MTNQIRNPNNEKTKNQAPIHWPDGRHWNLVLGIWDFVHSFGRAHTQRIDGSRTSASFYGAGENPGQRSHCRCCWGILDSPCSAVRWMNIQLLQMEQLMRPSY